MDSDVFLSHNGNDKPVVRQLKVLLAGNGLKICWMSTSCVPVISGSGYWSRE